MNEVEILKKKISFLKQEIQKLKEEVQQETNVKISEVNLNKNLSQKIETQKIYIETLTKINDDFIKEIAELRTRIKNIVLDMSYETTRNK